MKLKHLAAELAFAACLPALATPATQSHPAPAPSANSVLVHDAGAQAACLRSLAPYSNAWLTEKPDSISITIAGMVGELNCHVQVGLGTYDPEQHEQADYYVRLRTSDMAALIVDKVVDGEVEQLLGPHAKYATEAPLKLRMQVEDEYSNRGVKRRNQFEAKESGG